MKILILAVHYEVTGARYIADAFTRLGHEVKHYGGSASLKDAWGVDVPAKYIWKPDEIIWGEWTPDLIIIGDTNVTRQLPVELRTVPVVVWSNDNHVRNMRHMQADHYFLAHAHGQAQPVSHDDETWLPCATDATVFTPSPIPWEQREFDICCVGVMYPQRVAAIDALRKAGFKVFAATGLVYDEYKAAYHNSRASLCMSVNGDLAQRVFETAGMGCLVITDLLRDLENDVTRAKLGLSGFASTGFTVDNPNNINALVEQCEILLHGKGDPLYIEQAKASAAQLQAIVRERHTWDARAQVVVDWYQKEYGVTKSFTSNKTWEEAAVFVDQENQPKATLITKDSPIKVDFNGEQVTVSFKKPFLNLGCGRTHLPSTKPAGHEAVDDAVYAYPLWVNVDKVEGVGADKTFDLFTYPWPLEDNSFDGALLAHILEHVPHEIKVHDPRSIIASYNDGETVIYDGEDVGKVYDKLGEFTQLQDGWYAFWSELFRVLTPGALVHVVSPYGWSDGGITDPSHTRYLTMNTFTHSMTPDISDENTFRYNNGGINFVIDGEPQYRITPYGALLHERTGFAYDVLIGTYLNVCYDFYIKLKAVK